MVQFMINLLKQEFSAGVLYPFMVAFIAMLILSIFKISKKLRWLGGLIGGLLAILSMLKFTDFTNGNAYSLYITRHDKMIYLILLACIIAVVLSLLSLVIKNITALKILSFLLVIACVGVNLYWYKILKIQSTHFDYVPLVIVSILGVLLFGLVINDGFKKDVSSAIGLTAFCIVYGMVFQKYQIMDLANTLFSLAGVSVAYIFINYLIFSFRFSLALGLMMGGILISITTSEVLFNTTLDKIILLAPLVLLLVSPACRLFLRIIMKRTNKAYKYVIPIVSLLFSTLIGGAIIFSLF